jgi:hypothetical protein
MISGYAFGESAERTVGDCPGPELESPPRMAATQSLLLEGHKAWRLSTATCTALTAGILPLPDVLRNAQSTSEAFGCRLGPS